MLRMSKLLGVAAAALLLAGIVGGTAFAAESAGSHPGSLLLFPYFSNEPGINTYVRLTNTAGFGWLPGFFPDIRVHFIFFYKSSSTACSSISIFEPLTPSDTSLYNTATLAPGASRGFFIAKAASPIAGGPDIKWDYLVGDEIVLNTADGWAWSLNALGILADQDVAVGAGISAISGERAITGEPEDEIVGAIGDVDALDYEYINFPENFYFNYLTSKLGRATDVVMVALPRQDGPNFPPPAYVPTVTLQDDYTIITPTIPPFSASSTYNFDVTYWDADERQFSAPRSNISCWDVRSVDSLVGHDIGLEAYRGFGWMNVYGLDTNRTAPPLILPTRNRAILVTIDRPTVVGVSDAFANYSTADVSFGGQQVPPYVATTFDVSDF